MKVSFKHSFFLVLLYSVSSIAFCEASGENPTSSGFSWKTGVAVFTAVTTTAVAMKAIFNAKIRAARRRDILQLYKELDERNQKNTIIKVPIVNQDRNRPAAHPQPHRRKFTDPVAYVEFNRENTGKLEQIFDQKAYAQVASQDSDTTPLVTFPIKPPEATDTIATISLTKQTIKALYKLDLYEPGRNNQQVVDIPILPSPNTRTVSDPCVKLENDYVDDLKKIVTQARADFAENGRYQQYKDDYTPIFLPVQFTNVPLWVELQKGSIIDLLQLADDHKWNAKKPNDPIYKAAQREQALAQDTKFSVGRLGKQWDNFWSID